MIKNPESLIRQEIQFDCPICYQAYDDKAKYPMIICPYQHSCCLACLDNMLFKGKGQEQTISCPMCKIDICKKDARKFRLLNDIRKTVGTVRVASSSFKKEISRQKEALKQELTIQREKNEWLIRQIQQMKEKQMNDKEVIEKMKKQLYQQKEQARKFIKQVQKNFQEIQKQKQKSNGEMKRKYQNVLQEVVERQKRSNREMKEKYQNTLDQLQITKDKHLRQIIQEKRMHNLKDQQVKEQLNQIAKLFKEHK